MTPRVCPDSEDEDDEILYEDGPSEQSSFNQAVRRAGSALADEQSRDGGSNHRPRSTSSSDLMGPINQAQRGLFDSASAKTSMAAQTMMSSTSPVLSKHQRRHTNVAGPEGAARPITGPQRSKSANLEASLGATDPADSIGGNATMTPQVLQHSEHGYGYGLYGLPPGTIQQDFIQHDPNEMFRDSGSTVAFNESAEQRMLEEARFNITAYESNADDGSERDESSSFPWSTSVGTTQSPKSHAAKSQGEHVIFREALFASTGAQEQIPRERQDSEIQPEANEKQTAAVPLEPILDVGEDIIHVRKPPKSSPIVEIYRHEAAAEALSAPILPEMQKSTRGRKRKSEGTAESLTSTEDSEIGLPKEQYKPRLSRRRATHIAEDSIDYSLVPEKAARKRRKTAGATADVEQGTSDGLGTSKENALQVDEDEDKGSRRKPASKDRSSPSNPRTKQQTTTQDPEETNSPNKPTLNEETKPTASSKEPDTKAKSMAPPPIPPPSSKKVRRSKTTIFEDHITSGGSQRSPSLRQQQAARKSALDELPNESTQSHRRKRKTLLPDDDEDDEDELARPDPVEEDFGPKKRGRPAKAPATKKPKSSDRVVENSENSEDEPAQEEVEEEEEDEDEKSPPKKPSRGRPRKSTTTTTTTTPDELIPQNNVPTELPPKSTAPIDLPSSTAPALQPQDPNHSPKPPPTTTTSGPTSHSPLKPSSLVPLRVGLSKNRKIPSLLKNFRPLGKPSTK